MRSLVVLCAALSFAGCSGDEDPAPSPDAAPPADMAGNEDGAPPPIDEGVVADQGDAVVADVALPDATPIDVGPMVDSAVADEGASCRDEDCPGSQICVDGACAEGEGCAADLDCLGDRICVDGACAAPCEACPGAQICGEDGRCAEPAACGDDVDCQGDRICVDGACADRCGEDADCPGTRVCDGVTGRCPEAAPCFAEVDCDEGRLCSEGACAAACDAMNPCPAVEVCDAGICAPRCDGANPCPAGEVCAAGLCGPPPPCAGDGDCPAGFACDPATQRCTDAPLCVRDQDCPGARVCEAGRCVEPAVCFVSADCDPGRACLDGACVEACPGRACPGAQVCGPEGLCVEGEGCRADVDCLGDRVCIGGACAEPCREDAECPGNRQCVEGRCPEPANCFSPDDCDPGRVCIDFVCAAGCAGEGDCPGNQICAGGVCAEPMVCVGDLDCFAGRVCAGGACLDACRADADCPAGACDVATGRCGAPEVCVLDGECPGGLVCESTACVAAECELNADCPVSCVGRRCADGPPRLCDGDCEGALVCAPLGACVTDGPCADDAACPSAAPLCRAGRCVECGGDDDCPGAQRCIAGSCALLGACGGDGDCPGERACVDGLCAPVACLGDRFDVGGGGFPLALRTYDDLVLCDGATDRHLVEQPADRPLRILVVHAAGDLALAVRDEDGLAIAAVDTPYGIERVELAPVGAQRLIELEVSGREGAPIDYALVLEALAVDACPADRYEGLLGAGAASIGAGEIRHRLCPDDLDAFALDLPAGLRLTVTAFPALGADRVELTLRGPGGDLLARGAVDEDGDLVLDATIAAPGVHRLEFELPDAPPAGVADRFTVGLAAADDAVALACAHPAPIEAGVPLVLTPGPAVVRVPTGCGAGGQTWLATFDLDAPATVDLRLDGPQLGGAIEVRGDCADPGSVAQCVAGDPMGLEGDVRLDGLALPAGRYTVVVQASAGGPLTLHLERR